MAEGIKRIGIVLDEPRRGRPTDHDQAAKRSRALAKGNGQDRERFARGGVQGFVERVIGHVIVDDRPVFSDRALAEGALHGVARSHDPLQRTAGLRYQEFPGIRFQEGDGRPGAVEQLLRALRHDGQDALEVLRLQDRTARLAEAAETRRHVTGLRAALATHSARGLGGTSGRANARAACAFFKRGPRGQPALETIFHMVMGAARVRWDKMAAR